MATQDIYEIADRLRAIANLGLQYAASSYDHDRYEALLHESARLVAAIENRAVSEVMAQYRDNLGHVSPLAGADAAVFRDDRLLLIKRHDNGLWVMPGGLVDVGETIGQAAERELFEETGMHGQAARLLGIWDSRLVGLRVKAQMFDVCMLVHSDDEPATSAEALEVGFFSERELPALNPGDDVIVRTVFGLVREKAPPWFDRSNHDARV
jgi:8-oxo-dGTP pyrophosphatase MutT (NUDIX family)